MRIAHIIDSLSWGGAQKLEVTFAQVAHKRGIDLTVIGLRNHEDTPYANQLGDLGTQVVRFSSRRLLDPLRILRIARFLRQQRFDAIQTHLTYANIIGVIAARLANIPVAATLHSVSVEEKHFHPLKQQLEYWSLHYGASRIIAVGNAVAEVHQKEFGNRQIDIVPNAVPMPPALTSERRTKLRQQLARDPSRPIIISVGRLAPAKGYGDLLTAFGEVHCIHPEAVLVIVGDGTLCAELTRQIVQLGLQDNAFLTGSSTEVHDLLCASDLYVSASHWEGLPLAVLEAMGAGLPIVATDVGDIARVVGEAGVVLSPQSPLLLAKAICALLDDPKRLAALGAAAEAIVMRNHNPELWVDRLLTLYDQMRVARRSGLTQSEAH